MDVFNSFRRASSFNPDSLLNFSHLSVKTQHHLSKVYTTLCGLLVLAALGVFVQIKLKIDVALCGLAAFAFMMWFAFTPHDPYDSDKQTKRLVLLGTVAFLKGTILGPLVQIALIVDPMILVTAFAGTAIVFGCFSAAALTAQRRSYFYLAGILSSAISLLCLLSLLNIFFRSIGLYWLQIYGGLLVFSGYVVYDTQLIIEKSIVSAHPDFIAHSMELFVDFVAIFVRILVILLRNNQSKDRKDKNNRNR